jgi:LysM repeat protein
MPDDLKYLAVAESSLLTHVGSGDGAKGLWQLMTRTARHNGIRKDFMVDERLELEQATDVALNYLKMLKDKFNTWALTLAAYNCGEGCINNEIAEQGVTDYYRLNLPLESERFVFRIAAIKIVMDNPAHYGYSLAKEDQYGPIQYDTVPVDIKAALHITDVAKALDTDFKVMKELNPKIPGYYLPPGAYVINVPSGAGPKVDDIIEALEERASQLKTPSHFYIVRPGDTLEDISKKMGVSVARLKRLNRIKGSVIRVGQKLRL